MALTLTSNHRRLTPAPTTRRKGNPPVVLIAEDDPIMATLLSDYLRSRGFATLVAVDAMQTVMYATRGEPSVVLLDVAMPGGSGLHALHKLRENSKTAQLPVIAISGSQDPNIQRQLYDLGVDVFLAKPVDLEALNHRIRGRLEALALSA